MNTDLEVGVALLLLGLLVYVGGRLHQLARSTQERDEAYRDGYDDATRSLFHLATRVSQKIHAVPDPHTREMPAVAKPPAFPPVASGGPLPRRQPGEQRNQRRARHAA